MAESKKLLSAYRIMNKDEDTGKWVEVGAFWSSAKEPLSSHIKIGQYDLNVIADTATCNALVPK